MESLQQDISVCLSRTYHRLFPFYSFSFTPFDGELRCGKESMTKAKLSYMAVQQRTSMLITGMHTVG
ncbi:MAG: hypothetical protein WAM14_04630 [Candidatus Nitrosopolaris sp.]